MIKNCISIVALICFCIQGHCQNNSLLYKITSPTSVQPSYVLAICSLPGSEIFDMESAVLPVMSKVNTVAFTNIASQEEKEQLYSLMQLSDDNSLKRYYKREDQIRFELALKDKLQAEPENFYKTQPMYIYNELVKVDDGLAHTYMENVLFNLSLENTKPTLSLLTYRQLIGLSNSIDFDLQAALLIKYINEQNRDAIDAIFKAYSEQNLDLINSILYESENIPNSKYQIALTEKIASISEGQPTLFILDVKDVATEILPNLISKGFTVSPEAFILLKKDNRVTNSEFDQIKQTDNFPLLTSSNSVDFSQIKVFNEPIKSKNIYQKYQGYYDPFGDMFDYASADTSFLANWYQLKSTEGKFGMKIPKRTDWEISEIPSQGNIIKSYSLGLNDGLSDNYYTLGFTVYPPSFNAGDKAIFFNDFVVQQVRKLGGDLQAQRIISTTEFTGREFTVMVADSFFVRSQIILKDNILYQLLVGGPNNNAYSKYAYAFFNSFQLEGAKALDWNPFALSTFSCNFPTPPVKSSQSYNTASGALLVDSYSSEDYRENISYFVGVNTYPSDYSFKKSNAFYQDLISGAERTYAARVTKTENVKKNGIKGKYVEMQLNNGKVYRMYFFLEDNFVYQYLAGGLPSVIVSPNVQYFFDTFKFTGEE